MKTCSKCGIPQPLSEFFRNSKTKDGLLGRCKTCCAEYSSSIDPIKRKEHNKKNRDRRRVNGSAAAYSREYRKSHRAEVLAYERERRNKNKARIFAINSANHAVRDGKIKISPCVVCGSTQSLEKHHPDYSKPLEIVWLCRRHHLAVHGRRMFA
jgi:hypothetical protein